MSEVAYLLGAGASAGCIPVVNQMENEIKVLLEEIQPIIGKYQNNIAGDSRTSFRRKADFCKDVLIRLQSVCKDYYSIDTYAKVLYLTNSAQFEVLKMELCFYFTLMQIVRPNDKRYDNFFASVINEQGKLPPRIKIISWNYDFQLELSHAKFTEENNLNKSRSLLNMVSPSNYEAFSMSLNQFSVIKLNGSASFKTKDSIRYLCNAPDTLLEANLVNTFNEFYEIIQGKDQIETDLKFAWESKDYEDMFKIYRKELFKVDAVVVIGYSFPFFNRTIDIALFSAMENLKTIYIQDFEPDKIKEIMVEFVGDKSVDITYVGKTNLSQFVFPKELDITGPLGHSLHTLQMS